MRWLMQTMMVGLAFTALIYGAMLKTGAPAADDMTRMQHGSLVIYKTHRTWPDDPMVRLRTSADPQVMPNGSDACVIGQCQDI